MSYYYTAASFDPGFPDAHMQMRYQIKSELKHNQKVKALLREGRQPQGADWVRSKQAQCAILGHVPPKNGMKCYFCGADL